MTGGMHPVPTTANLGQLVTDAETNINVKDRVAQLCRLNTFKFPGSQPVSFDTASLELLERENFWVCEKSDGIRVLVAILGHAYGQEVFLIDRKEKVYNVQGLFFPHFEDPDSGQMDTVIDGELVIDVDPNTGEHKLRLLAFDALCVAGKYLLDKTLERRYGHLMEWVVRPYESFFRKNPELVARLPFEVKLKKMELAHGIDKVLKEHMPSLLHGSDGLIFTSAEAPYTIGTDPRIIKWKPPSENSLDFRLELRFPPSSEDSSQPDFTLKPVFMLQMNCGRLSEKFFDTMLVTDDEWEEAKATHEQWDDRVVEVVWDKQLQGWRKWRFRDDKNDGNFSTVVDAVIISIRDGVEADTLVERSPAIKAAYKARQAKAAALRSAPPLHQPPPVQAAPQPAPRAQARPAPRSTGGLRR